ncbi:MAG: RHS repeat-associated core domain-containing protein, partial [Candidatus Aminicenantes bacterium]|nr:RHS repeat-associated core domain-containing protein [Candidatus Aminicenantes bacterium]
IKEKAAESCGEKEDISIERSSNNLSQSLRIEADSEHETVVVKSFRLPLNFPFDVSDKPFEIRYNEDMNRSISPISPGNERAEAYSNEMDDNAHGPYYPPFVTDAVTSSSFGQIQAVTVTYTDTYYIYSFDGKLLSEYDQTGSCVRDYIYAGNRLLAEYRPSTGKYYYYMSDQINSTRIITDDVGNIVYSEAYGPYGDVQKTWTKTYDPKQKFSGKEREGYSELDYFGARYFDNNSYRFISVDPVINKEEAISNPQLWNLYAYCANNPITHLDSDGRRIEFAEGSSKTFKNHIVQMKAYLNKSPLASKIIRRIEKSKETILIKEAQRGECQNFHSPSKTITINSTEGLKVKGGPFNGLIQSPALGYFHELAHAYNFLNDYASYQTNNSIVVENYEDLDEFLVIDQYETRVGNDLGEPIRVNHDGELVQVKGPTSKQLK